MEKKKFKQLHENKIKNSEMNDEILKGICKHIETHYSRQPFSLLKLSFFGGEPLMKPNIVKNFIKFAKQFCFNNDIDLLFDFTTNGTLISNYILDLLKDSKCMFQITLDGNREQHNKIKYVSSKTIDTFELTLNNIHRIQKYIPNSSIAVRINFDRDTLRDFDSILNNLLALDKTRILVIIKKIWQVDTDDISKKLIFDCLEKLFVNEFLVDYYSQGGVCFADRQNQVTFNYDGNVFKCTTISHFDDDNALGKLDINSGEVIWNKDKIRYLNEPSTSKRCKSCKLLPFCGGHCRKHIHEGNDEGCFLDSLNMTIEEFAEKQFLINIIKNRVNGAV